MYCGNTGNYSIQEAFRRMVKSRLACMARHCLRQNKTTPPKQKQKAKVNKEFK